MSDVKRWTPVLNGSAFMGMFALVAPYPGEHYVLASDYDALLAENAKLQSAYDGLLADLKQLGDPLALEKLMQYAERYRWLREHGYKAQLIYGYTAAGLDSAIDAALKDTPGLRLTTSPTFAGAIPSSAISAGSPSAPPPPAAAPTSEA